MTAVCCHKEEADKLRERVRVLEHEIGDLTTDLQNAEGARWERDDLNDQVVALTEAIEDHARGVVTLGELVEKATGRRP